MRFDGYAGTLQPGMDEVAQVLAWALKATVSRGRPIKRFGEVLRVEHAGHCAVWVGRDHGNGCTYFEGKGESSPELVQAVRKHFPKHAVSRGDTCDDRDHEEAFERLQTIVRDIKGPRVKAGYVALPDDPRAGRTWAAGVRGGVSYIRIYEAGKMTERAHLGRRHWVRIENEARPHYAADKVAAATMEPLEFWGFSRWTKRVAEALTGLDVPRYASEREAPTYHKTTAYLARAFRRYWEESLAEGRDWACIGREFEAIWRDDDAVKEAMKQRP